MRWILLVLFVTLLGVIATSAGKCYLDAHCNNQLTNSVNYFRWQRWAKKSDRKIIKASKKSYWWRHTGGTGRNPWTDDQRHRNYSSAWSVFHRISSHQFFFSGCWVNKIIIYKIIFNLSDFLLLRLLLQVDRTWVTHLAEFIIESISTNMVRLTMDLELSCK